MAVTKLTDPADEEGTYAVVFVFTDELDAELTPKTLKWTLRDTSGNVINSRTLVTIAAPASTETIVLSGDDLAVDKAGGDSVKRRLCVIGTYDSDLGTDLPLTREVEFEICQYAGVG